MIGDMEITDVPMYLRARHHGISYLPQEASVFRKLSVEENILAVLETQSSTWEERHEQDGEACSTSLAWATSARTRATR